jgi:hypothetical protein
VIFEVSAVVLVKIYIFWGVTFWWLVNNYRHLGYDCCFCLQSGPKV